MVDEYQDKKDAFNSSLKTLNRNIYNLNKTIKDQTVKYAKNKVGSLNLDDMGMAGRIAEYSNSPKSVRALEKNTVAFSRSAKDLTESIDNLASITQESSSSFKEFISSMDGFTARLAPVLSGAYRGAKGATKLGMKAAGLPFKAVGAGWRGMTNASADFSQSAIGDTNFKESFKKLFGGLMTTGIFNAAAGTTLSTAMGRSEGPGFVSRSIGATAEGIERLSNFFMETGGKAGRGIKQGIGLFNVGPSKEFQEEFDNISDSIGITNKTFEDLTTGDASLSVSPSDDFKELLEDAMPSSKKFKKDLSESFSESLIGKGRKGILMNTLGNIFGRNVILSYALPVKGLGYRSELPTPGKYGFMGAMLKTLGLLYVHSRFASDEVNKLLMEQSKLLQIGFEIPGTLYKPGSRSLSEWLGRSISESLGEVMGGEGKTPFAYFKDFVTGKSKELFKQMGVSVSEALGFDKQGNSTGKKGLTGAFNKYVPGYENWKKGRAKEIEAAQIGKSETALRTVELLTEIRDLLSSGAKISGVKRNKKGIPRLAEALEETKVVEEGGLTWLDPGEMVGRVATFYRDIKGKASDRYKGMKEKFTSYYEQAKGSKAGKKASEYYGNVRGAIANKRDELNNVETSGGKLGFFGTILKGVLNFFSGGIFTKISNFFKALLEITKLTLKGIRTLPIRIKNKFSELWEDKIKPTFELLRTDMEILNETYKTEGLGSVLKKGSKGIGGAFMAFINNLPDAITKVQGSINKKIMDMFSKDLSERATSITDVLKKIWVDMLPDVLKNAIKGTYDATFTILANGAKGAGEIIKAAGTLGKIIVDYSEKFLVPMQDAWGKGETWTQKIINTISSIPAALTIAWKEFGGTVSKIGDVLSDLLDPIMNLMSIPNVKGMAMFKTRRRWKRVKQSAVKSILPKPWANVTNIIMNRMFDLSMLAFDTIISLVSSPGVAKKAFSDKMKKEKESGKGGFGSFISSVGVFIKGLFIEATKPLRFFVKRSIKSFNVIIKEMESLTKGGKTSKIANVIDNLTTGFKELGTNLSKLVTTISESMSKLGAFVTPPPEAKKMARGGLIYAANGVVVGEAGAEAVLPLDHPSAIKKISNVIKSALWGKGEGDAPENPIVLRLTKIESVLIMIHDKLQSMPLYITKGFISGIRSGLGEFFGGTARRIPKAMEAIMNTFNLGIETLKLGIQGLRETMSFGFKTLGKALNTGLEGIRFGMAGVRKWGGKILDTMMLPFKAAWGIIKQPFKYIGKKLGGIKERILHPFRTIKEHIEKKIYGSDVISVGPDGKPVLAKWPSAIRTAIDNVRDILWDQTVDQQTIGLKVIGLLAKINAKTILDEDKVDRMEPIEPLPTLSNKKRKSKAGLQLNFKKDKQPGKPGLLSSLIGKAKDFLMNNSITKWFTSTAIPGLISAMGPALAVLGAGAIGVLIGKMLNDYVVKPFLDGLWDKKERERKEAAKGAFAAQQNVLSPMQNYRLTGTGKEAAVKAGTAAKIQREFLRGSSSSKRIGEIFPSAVGPFGTEASGGQQAKLGIVRDAQIQYMSEHMNEYMKYGTYQVGELREKWLDRGGFREKRPFESWQNYGFKREEKFLKYLKSKGKALSIAEIEEQAFAGVKGLPTKAYAKGGLITKPTLALMGEHGPEIVVPLESGLNKLAPSDKIAEHQVMMQYLSDKAGGKDILSSHKELGSKLEKLARATNFNSMAINNFVTTSNSSNVNASDTTSMGLDADTEKLIGGKL